MEIIERERERGRGDRDRHRDRYRDDETDLGRDAVDKNSLCREFLFERDIERER